MSLYPIGTKVVISKDCRTPETATGQHGVLEGDFPYTIAVNNGQSWLPGEWSYDRYISGELKLTDGTPLKDIAPPWTGGKKPAGWYVMPMDNPRIRIGDGSVIWGAECWWDVDRGQSPEEIAKDFNVSSAFFREVAKFIMEEKAAEGKEES